MEPFVRRHDCHVRRDEAVLGVQRRGFSLLLAIGPQGQVKHGARWHHRRVEDVGCCVAGRSAGAALHSYRFLAPKGAAALPRVQHATRRHRIHGQPPGSRRGKVAIDVDQQIGGVVGVDFDAAIGSRRHDGAFATSVAVGLLRVETTGCGSPAGQTDRYPNGCPEGLGTTVKFSEYARGLRPVGMQVVLSAAEKCVALAPPGVALPGGRRRRECQPGGRASADRTGRSASQG
jgi:hypothetical protein